MDEKLFLLGLYIEERAPFKAVNWTKREVLESLFEANKQRANKLIDIALREIEQTKKKGYRIVYFGDSEYPEELKLIPYPPPFIYIAGELRSPVRLAVVGTRKPSPYGKEVTKFFTEELASWGISIVSGFARGVDTIAHRATLERGGHTVAVLGSGLDVIYPPENHSLSEAILSSGGAIVSEFPLGTKPKRENFPRRNRIISGLSVGILVTEAGEKSGTLHTVRWAQEQGKDVFAVPGNIFSENSKGTHFLIKEGAIPVTHPAEILYYLGLDKREYSLSKDIILQSNNRDESNLSDLEKRVLECVSTYPIHLDSLYEMTKIPIPELLTTLSELEIKGLIKPLPGKFFQKI